jgi:hypothetical protein
MPNAIIAARPAAEQAKGQNRVTFQTVWPGRVECLPTRDEHAHARAALKHRLGEGRDLVEEVLAVIQDAQRCALAQVSEHVFDPGSARLLPDPQGRSHLRRDERGVAEAR